jgi:hypothetical protein
MINIRLRRQTAVSKAVLVKPEYQGLMLLYSAPREQWFKCIKSLRRAEPLVLAEGLTIVIIRRGVGEEGGVPTYSCKLI